MATRRIWAAFMISPTGDHLPDTRLVQGRLRSPQEVDRVLYVPGLPSRYGPPHQTDCSETEGTEESRDAQDGRGVHLPVSYQASPSYGLGSGLELGLYEQYRLPHRRRRREDAFERDQEGDEREVGHHKVGVEWQIFSGQPAHIGTLQNGDAGVVTQRPVELAVADVDGEHPLGPPLQQGVGEPSRRCSSIEAGTSLHRHAEPGDGDVQFLAGARDEAFVLGD